MVYHAATLYPNEEGVQFDETYYLQTHMPFVESIWKQYGLLGWKTFKYPTALDGSRSQYLISTQLEFENGEGLQKALQDPRTSKIFEDLPNFTNAQAVTLGGTQL
ncbi:hypothetical protein FSARC_11110 [Fusarium sarcochroum]|uniref:EthD domain-containing protein n=1 Tax=Fusarium sarcochroum TaxID=1208366 RepID=A0A8H4THQ2_9HYPO|nr:hypothetical protein FSARC_11110 [Fusarium sarcochroum]